MRDFLADKLAGSGNPQGVHIHRRKIERWGDERAMDPKEASRLFEDPKGVAWFVEYHESERLRWTGGWVAEVRSLPARTLTCEGGCGCL